MAKATCRPEDLLTIAGKFGIRLPAQSAGPGQLEYVDRSRPVACIHPGVGTGLPLLLHRREVRLHQHQPGLVTTRAMAAADGAIPVGTPPERRRYRPRLHRLGLDRQARLLGRRNPRR